MTLQQVQDGADAAPSRPAARIATLRAELRDDSVFVATPTPRLSWTVATDEPDWRQASAEFRSGDDVVRVDTDASVLVDWPFAPLAAGETREVRVRATAASGTITAWSESLAIAAGFLAEGAWIAEPVGLASPDRPAQPALVRTTFTVDEALRRATLYYTALGVAEPELNGARVDDDVLAPGWSSYRDRLVHETVDVTGLVREGENVLGATIAGGWYTEQYGFFRFAERVYGDQPRLLAQLHLEYADGRSEVVATGDGWRAFGDGPLVDSGIYAGEHADLRRGASIAGWSTPEFDASAWPEARLGASAREGYEHVPEPEARIAPPVRRIDEVPVAEVLTAPSGATILDFG
ncbi:MAG TPA: alpha-L-rhamnosidase N-terminal domain-containing protein, partial [Agromyces sp.]|nr:alpha-L-rhamnosidase N-terminal domain-containing protein [Agromyces sp.]